MAKEICEDCGKAFEPKCSKGRICPSCHKKRLSRYAKERKLNEIGTAAYSEQCALRRAERKGGQAPQREDV